MSSTYLQVIGVDAGADLNTGSINDGTGTQYKAVTAAGVIAANATTALGILQNKPKSGEDASLGFAGRSRYVAGAAVAVGARLTVTTSGYMTTAGSGDDFIGRALGAVSSGGIGEGAFNFLSGQA